MANETIIDKDDWNSSKLILNKNRKDPKLVSVDYFVFCILFDKKNPRNIA